MTDSNLSIGNFNPNIKPLENEKQKDETSDPYLKAKMNDMLIVYKELEDKIYENIL